jgi:cyclopropane-fatty-acyl-phospholipid synthase
MERMENLTVSHNNAHLKINGESKIILDALQKCPFGNISVEYKGILLLEKINDPNIAIIKLSVNDLDVFSDILKKSDIGLAEAYIDKRIEINSIEDFIVFSIANESILKKAFLGDIVKILYYRLKHEARENSIEGSKKNIHEHYDLGNKFYSLWLDKTMSYSSAIFKNSEESLSQAQINKYERMLQSISPSLDEHILEIGCGWGGFLEYAGVRGHKITGITISNEQYLYAKDRIKRLNLEDRVKVLLCDYRNLKGQFDHAVSIEMIEAVGEKYWEDYFELFKKHLKKGSRFSIQAITIKEENFNQYRKSTDFIQQFIFPGGMLLANSVFDKYSRKFQFKKIDQYEFGLDYAKTLNIWQKEFNFHREVVTKIGFDERFIRLWNFYLEYCSGAFKARRINVIQYTAELL